VIPIPDAILMMEKSGMKLGQIARLIGCSLRMLHHYKSGNVEPKDTRAQHIRELAGETEKEGKR
jgi:hypothetical protein